MRRHCHHLIIIFGLLGMLLFEGGCAQDNVDSEVLKTAKILQSKTIPSEAKNLVVSNVVRSSSSAAITWEFEVTLQKNNYFQWSKNQLQSVLKFSKQEEYFQEWRQSLPGDIYDLQIKIIRPESPIKVQIIFISSVF